MPEEDRQSARYVNISEKAYVCLLALEIEQSPLSGSFLLFSTSLADVFYRQNLLRSMIGDLLQHRYIGRSFLEMLLDLSWSCVS